MYLFGAVMIKRTLFQWNSGHVMPLSPKGTSRWCLLYELILDKRGVLL